MGDIIVIGKRERCPEGYLRVDCTSNNRDPIFKEGLSPFYLGPVECYDGLKSLNMENAWQFAKVYRCHIDNNEEPTEDYLKWRNKGWGDSYAHRRPMGYDKPLYSYWKTDGEYRKLGYIDARKEIYIPLYAKAVINKRTGLEALRELLETNNLALADFDGYNHKKLGMTYDEVIHCGKKRMGHAFVIAMILKNYLSVQGDKVVYNR